MNLPALDAHAHLDTLHPAKALACSGAVLAMTLSLDEGERALGRQDANVAWGVGCHPRIPKAQEGFSRVRFEELVQKAPIVGEIGLDAGSRVPMEVQLRNFRQALEVISHEPRLASIHAFRATGLVLKELRRRPISIPVLHWWTGSADETCEAVELGCYFSIHSAVARQSRFRTRVPPERILVESDHGYNDPPQAIPCRIEWVEHLVAQQFRKTTCEIRELGWRNLGTIVTKAGTRDLLPSQFNTNISQVQ